MAGHIDSATTPETREARIDAFMQQLRPKIETTVRQLVERAVYVPEAEEFGAIDLEFRDADACPAWQTQPHGDPARTRR